MRAGPLRFQPPEHLDEVQPLYLRHVRARHVQAPKSQQLSFWHDVVWRNALPTSIFIFELVSREGLLYNLLPEEGRSVVEPTFNYMPEHLPEGQAPQRQEGSGSELEWLSGWKRPPHWRPLNPHVVKRLFEGLLQRLRIEKEHLPLIHWLLIHWLYERKAGKRVPGPTGLCAICARDSPEVGRLRPIEPPAEGERPADDEDELPLFLQGWHKDVEHRHELRIWDVSPEATATPEFRPRGWIPAAKRFTFGDSDVEVETQYAVDFFKPEIDNVLQHCDQAIRLGVPIYWLSRVPKAA